MLYIHKESGEQYRFLMRSFCVERQTHQVIYIQLKTGRVFNRDDISFFLNFVQLCVDPQAGIVPKDRS